MGRESGPTEEDLRQLAASYGVASTTTGFYGESGFSEQLKCRDSSGFGPKQHDHQVLGFRDNGGSGFYSDTLQLQKLHRCS
jgi:hypothetical protein